MSARLRGAPHLTATAALEEARQTIRLLLPRWRSRLTPPRALRRAATAPILHRRCLGQPCLGRPPRRNGAHLWRVRWPWVTRRYRACARPHRLPQRRRHLSQCTARPLGRYQQRQRRRRRQRRLRRLLPRPRLLTSPRGMRLATSPLELHPTLTLILAGHALLPPGSVCAFATHSDSAQLRSCDVVSAHVR